MTQQPDEGVTLHMRGPLWRSRQGQPPSPNRVTILISEHFASLGLPYTAHNCRHRYGTRLYQLSGDLRMVQGVMGHSSPSTTALYTQWSPRAAIDAVTQLDEALTA